MMIRCVLYFSLLYLENSTEFFLVPFLCCDPVSNAEWYIFTQSIFSFNGADISGFDSFRKDFPNYKEVCHDLRLMLCIMLFTLDCNLCHDRRLMLCIMLLTLDYIATYSWIINYRVEFLQFVYLFRIVLIVWIWYYFMMQIRLNKNYRSTRCIIEAASSVIKNNIKRCQLKHVDTDNCSGSKVVLTLLKLSTSYISKV